MIDVKIIADSIGRNGQRLTTLQLKFHRFVLSEFNTHRMFSRNASSSRAIPVSTLMKRMKEDPAIPVKWGKNQKGMQASEFYTEEEIIEIEKDWLELRDIVMLFVQEKFLDKWNLHKQIANRPLEAWMWTRVVVTATEWDNYMNLRCHPDAQPEIEALAQKMRITLLESEPQLLEPMDWHLPYILEEDYKLVKQMTDNTEKQGELIKAVSTARCARVSYLTHDGLKPAFEKDLELHDQLISSGHMCYDRSTEVLTKEGWKFWDEVNYDDELASYDYKNSESVSFEKPQKLHRSFYDGKMYHVETRKLDLLVTPNHNMVVRKRISSKRDFSEQYLEPAEKVFGKERHYCSAGILDNSLRKRVDKPLEWFSLLGFFIGDGYMTGRGSSSFHLKKKRKIKYLYSLCDKLGITIRNTGDDKYRLDLDIEFDECYNEEREKVLPEFCLFLPKDQVDALLGGLRNSDGSPKHSSWVYSTTSEALKDQLQMLGVLNGFYFHENHTHLHNDVYIYRMYFSTNIRPEVSKRYSGEPESWVDFSDDVFCATVSTGALIVRRNGKIVVSGNSPTEHPAQYRDDYKFYGNFKGYKQYRKMIPNEDIFRG